MEGQPSARWWPAMHDGAIPISSNQNRQNKGLARSGGNSSASLLEANGHPDF